MFYLHSIWEGKCRAGKSASIYWDLLWFHAVYSIPFAYPISQARKMGPRKAERLVQHPLIRYRDGVWDEAQACGSQATALAKHHSQDVNDWCLSCDWLWVKLVRSGRGSASWVESTGELRKEVNRNLSLFLELPTEVTVFALLIFSDPCHCTSSLWKQFFCNGTVRSYILPYLNVQRAWHIVDAPTMWFLQFQLYLWILRHGASSGETHFVVCTVGLNRCGNTGKWTAHDLSYPRDKKSYFPHLTKTVRVRIQALKTEISVAKCQCTCAEA